MVTAARTTTRTVTPTSRTATTTRTATLPGSATAAEPAPIALSLRGVTKTYGTVRAVDGLDLDVELGSVVAILGPNGAGKSTTNEMITGIVTPDTGTVSVLGTGAVEAVRAGRVGAMLQAGALLAEARVCDVIALMHGLHVHPLPIGEVVERADLGSFWRTRTEKLSGGQAQRLRYALALLPDPELLILDEPTVGMDVELRRRFWASMDDFAATGRTVLFATHYLDEADEVADRIVVVAGGRLIADGTGAEIKSSVAGRTVSAAAAGLDPAGLEALPGVLDVTIRGPRVLLRSSDSDATVRALLAARPDVHDLEIASARLEDAFVELTATPATSNGAS